MDDKINLILSKTLQSMIYTAVINAKDEVFKSNLDLAISDYVDRALLGEYEIKPGRNYKRIHDNIIVIDENTEPLIEALIRRLNHMYDVESVIRNAISGKALENIYQELKENHHAAEISNKKVQE